MPGEIVGLYLIRSPEVHGCRRVLRTYMTVQLHQCVYICVPLQYRVVRAGRVSKRADLLLRQFSANKSYPTVVRKMPGSVERWLLVRRFTPSRTPEFGVLRLSQEDTVAGERLFSALKAVASPSCVSWGTLSRSCFRRWASWSAAGGMGCIERSPPPVSADGVRRRACTGRTAIQGASGQRTALQV